MSRKRKTPESRSDPLEGLSPEQVGKYIFEPTRLTTPEVVDSKVAAFCAEISPDEEPVFLRPNPQLWSRHQYCNKNVERMVSLYGGEVELGFRIWYVPDLYIEAERHAVWIGDDGSRMDISFYPDGEDRILFLPAPHLDTVLIADHLKPRFAYHPSVSRFVRTKQESERQNPIPRDDTWEGWETQLTFEQWQLRPWR